MLEPSISQVQLASPVPGRIFFFFFNSKSGDKLKQVALRSCGCPIIANVQGQLNGVLSNLMWGNISLPMAEGGNRQSLRFLTHPDPSLQQLLSEKCDGSVFPKGSETKYNFFPFSCWLCALLAYSTDTYGFLKTLLVQLMRTGTQDNTRSIQF